MPLTPFLPGLRSDNGAAHRDGQGWPSFGLPLAPLAVYSGRGEHGRTGLSCADQPDYRRYGVTQSGPSSMPMGADYGRRRMNLEAPYFSSLAQHGKETHE